MIIIITSALLLAFASAQAQLTPKGETLIGNQVFDVYETQDQDVVFKKRTDKSPNPEEKPSDSNILNRQSIFEIGFSAGLVKASRDSQLVRNADGTQVQFGDLFGVPTYTSDRGLIFNLHFNYHPQVDALRRLTVGAEASHRFGPAGTLNVPTFAETKPRGSIAQNWALMAEYDLIVVPNKSGAMAYSAGYSYGQARGTHFYDRTLYPGDPIRQHYIQGRVRWILDSKKGHGLRTVSSEEGSTNSTYFLLGKVSNKGEWSFTAGFLYGFGKRSSPKVVRTK